MLGTHHKHLRKRIYKNLEKYPHDDALKRTLDKIIYVVGFLGPASTLPQLYEIYTLDNTVGISVATWGLYTFFNIIWMLYALIHREPVLIFTYTLWLIVNGAVVIGVLL